MTRQLPKPVAVPLGWIICGAINAAIYGGGFDRGHFEFPEKSRWVSGWSEVQS